MTKPSVVARESQHTALPWSYSRTHGLSADTWYVLTDSEGRGPIFDVGGKDKLGQIAVAAHLITDPATIQANAEFIVRACNAHTSLVEALQSILNCFQPLARSAHEVYGTRTFHEEITAAEQALRLAQGEK